MIILDNDNESPTVRKMKRELDNLRERSAKVEGLCRKYLAQQGMSVEEFSAQMNTITRGRDGNF